MKDVIQEAYIKIVTQDEQLDEGMIKNAIATASLAVAVAGGINALKHTAPDETSRTAQGIATQVGKSSKDFNLPRDHLLNTVKSKFNIDDDKASKIVDTAIKYSHPVFPQAHHILSIVGIESSFNEKAKSKLKFDPAVGLMQIRPKTWGIDPKEMTSIEGQIKHGAHILNHYHTKTGGIDSAVKAYNIGLTNFNRGKQQDAAHRYVTKFKKELSRYSQN